MTIDEPLTGRFIFTTRWKVAGLLSVIVALLLCVTIGLWAVAAPPLGRLDVTIGEPETTYDLRSGSHGVRVRLLPTGDDNGVVEMVVEVDGRRAATIESMYDYDLFSNQPAGEWTYRWLDGDVLPDLVLITSTEPAQSVFVGTLDGQVHAIP